MKYVKWIFVVVYIISLTSFVEKDKPTKGLNVGDVAPNLNIQATHRKQSFELKQQKNKYTLLSFWASYDAPSRANNAGLNNVLQKINADVTMVSISFDEYESVFTETIRKDQLRPSTCFVDTKGESSSIFKTYRLNKGFRNYLLNESGVIVAKNISASELASYLN